MAEPVEPIDTCWSRYPSSEASAWTANVKNWAMSSYRDVYMDNVTLVYEDGAPDSTEDALPAIVKTGRLEASENNIVGATRCMCTVKTDPPLYLTTFWGDHYQSKEFSYQIPGTEMPYQDAEGADSPELSKPQLNVSRVRLGKGAKGTHWGLRVNNPDNKVFDLHDLKLTVENAGINR